ncbi:hypothetical protein GVAV_001188 [Gurleya vavrai]
MNNFILTTATKMNKVKFMFVEKNNNIYKLINDNLEKKKENLSIFSPEISNKVRNNINDTLNSMKKQSTSVIEIFLRDFIESEKNLQKDSFSTAKSRRFSKGIIELLENSFFANEYPSDPEKQAIANACKITTKQVNNWFTNKRNRAKNMRSGSKKIN